MYPDLSIVVPVFNEEKSIQLLYDRLVNAIISITTNFEIMMEVKTIPFLN